jgi:hypothetical protein
MTRVVRSYVSACDAISSDDSVIDAYCTATNDLHEQAASAAARNFSRGLLTGIRDVAMAIARNELVRKERKTGSFVDGQALFRFMFWLPRMIDRRLSDDNSGDSAYGLRILGVLGAASAQLGESWIARTAVETIGPYAAPATKFGRVHLAWPAWEAMIQVIVALVLLPPGRDDDVAIDAVIDDFTQALGAVERVPSSPVMSGFEPIISTLPASDRLSLQSAAYYLWTAPAARLDALEELATRTTSILVDLALASEQRHIATKYVAETLHQFNVAALIRADQDAENRSRLVAEVASRLNSMRRLVLSADGVVRGSADVNIWTMYEADVIIGLYTCRDDSQGAEPLVAEIQAAITEAQAVSYDFRRRMGTRALELIAVALLELGHVGAANRVNGESKPRDLADVEAFMLYRGALRTPIHQAAEAWLSGAAKPANKAPPAPAASADG